MKFNPTCNGKVPLKNLNTFKVSSYAYCFIEFSSVEELLDKYITLNLMRERGIYVLGEGSNVLLTKEEYWEPIIRFQDKTLHVEKEGLHDVVVKVGGGWNWDAFVDFAVRQGWGGLENLSLIPGTVGAAPVQNIGAYGVEIAELIEAVEIFWLDKGDIQTLVKEECEFTYRNSIFKNELKDKVLITAVIFRLRKNSKLRLDYPGVQERVEQFSKGSKPTIEAVRRAIIAIREEKMPDYHILGNAGSFFKNPVIDLTMYERLRQIYPDIPGFPIGNQVKVSAAWLIEQCGWKGKRIGDVGTYPKHALIIVNYGNATGKEIVDFATSIQQDVWNRFQIALEPEVNFW